MVQTIKTYAHTVVASDVVIFAFKDEKLQVLLIKMKKPPFVGHWAAPGGLVRADESLDRASDRLLVEKTGIKQYNYREQLYTFGDVGRDPFGRVVSVSYMVLLANTDLAIKTTMEYEDIAWFSVDNLPSLAYDHDKMINLARNRLNSKFRYSNIAFGLMPEEFTLSSLKTLYEVIFDRKFEKRNFRKKIISLKMVEKAGKKQSGVAYRPAELYKFSQKDLDVVNFFLFFRRA